MAENTPFYMDINNVYSGDELGLPNRDIFGEGIVAATDLAVTAGTGNTVNVAAGAGWVIGDTDTNRQPTYRIYNDAVVNKGITPDPTNPRYVRVVAQITDATFSGVLRNWVITAIHGTPAASPAIPALPASAMDLATILVPAAAASSAAYTITNTRVRARIGGGSVLGAGRQITGVITGSTGAIVRGTGFTAVRNSAGIYTITFTTAFSAVPVLSVTTANGAPSGYNAIGTGSLQILTYSSSFVASDADFNFVVTELQ